MVSILCLVHFKNKKEQDIRLKIMVHFDSTKRGKPRGEKRNITISFCYVCKPNTTYGI